MATQMRSTSRRELLRGAIVAGAACSVSAAAATPTAVKWLQAVALERSSETALDTYHAAYVVPPSDRHAALCKTFGPRPFTPSQIAILAAIDCHQDQFNDLVTVHYEAFEALMTTPAPDVAAIAYKLKLFTRDDAWEFMNVAEMVAAIQADAVRLSQGGA